uniref:Uncharacterized protein n=1 Tax=Arundo donax TaxID=35708 RepID=A0A0A9HGR6_ARUDO
MLLKVYNNYVSKFQIKQILAQHQYQILLCISQILLCISHTMGLSSLLHHSLRSNTFMRSLITYCKCLVLA